MNQSLIVISRAHGDDGERRAFEDQLATELGRSAAAAVVTVPPVYYLDDDHRATARLRETEGPMTIATWLHPRATEWILRSLGVEESIAIEAVDLRAFDSLANAANELRKKSNVEASDESAPDGRGEEIDDDAPARWHPVIDRSRCVDCLQCLEFCLFRVFDKDAEGKLVVAEPSNCKPGCPACARVCPVGAIIFPHYATDEAIAGDNTTPIARLDEADADRLACLARSGRLGEVAQASAEAKAPANDGPDELDDLIDALEDLERG